MLAEAAGGIVAVLAFALSILSRMKKMWVETAKQTWLLEDLSIRLSEHLTQTHKEQDRRLHALERRARS